MIKIIVLFIYANTPKHPGDEAKFRIAGAELRTGKRVILLSDDPTMKAFGVGDCLVLSNKKGEKNVTFVKRCN